MKKSIKKYNVLGAGLFLSAIFLFASCKNFFNGGKIINDIEDAVEYSLSKEYTVRVAVDASNGTLVAGGGDHKVKVTDKISLAFLNNDSCRFLRWEAVKKSDTEVLLSDYVKFDDPESLETIATILIGSDDILIRPSCYVIPVKGIRISSDCGYVSPSGINDYREGNTYNVFFTPNADYQFLEWEVIDSKTGLAVNEDYVVFDDPFEMNTNWTFNKAPEDEDYGILIRPKCAKRPKVVSSSPTYDSDGVYRDRRLTVMFDQKLTEDIIYYSSEEVQELKSAGYKILSEKVDSEIKYYGYQSEGDDNSIVYKCLKITKLNDPSENLLKFYGVPVLDQGNTGVLRLSTKNNELLPPMTTDILVTVLKDIGVVHSKSNNEKLTVGLASEYSWSYFTNSKFDNENPEINELKLWTAKGGMELGKENFSVASFNADQKSEIWKKRKENNAPDRIWISGKFKDGGSGPKAMSAKVYRINDAVYPAEPSEEAVISYDAKLEVVGSIAEIKSDDGEGEYLDLSSLDEGFYKIIFTVSDKNELRTDSEPFYFVCDHVAPKIPVTVIENDCMRTSVSSEKMKWASDYFDFEKVRIERYEADPQGNISGGVLETTELISGNEYTFTTLENNQQKYAYKIYAVDFNGNESKDYSLYTDNKSPSTVNAVNRISVTGRKETVSWAKADSVDFDHVVIEEIRENIKTKEKDKLIDDVILDNTTFTYDVPERDPSDTYLYHYRFYSVDFAGNKSDLFCDYVEKIAPASLSNVYTGSRFNTVTVYFDTPDDIDFDYVEIQFNGKRINVTSAGRNSHGMMQITNLSEETNYNFNVYAVDFAGNYSEVCTVSEKPGVRNGKTILYYDHTHKELLCSDKLYDKYTESSGVKNGFEALGVVFAKKSDGKKVKVWEIKNDVCGRTRGWTSGDNGDGIDDYKTYTEKNKTKPLNLSYPNTLTIYPYLVWVKNPESPVTWFLPTYNECNAVFAVKGTLTETYASLKNKGYTKASVYDPDTDGGKGTMYFIENYGAVFYMATGGYCRCNENTFTTVSHYLCEVDLSMP